MHEVDTEAAIGRLMRFLAVPGVTGRESLIAADVAAALKEAGVPAKAIRLDDANKRIPVPTETGNLIVDLPGRGAMHNQPRILFMTHMDTVPLCAGAKPRIDGKRIVNDAKTALGGDNRTGCAVLVTLMAEMPEEASEASKAMGTSCWTTLLLGPLAMMRPRAPFCRATMALCRRLA